MGVSEISRCEMLQILKEFLYIFNHVLVTFILSVLDVLPVIYLSDGVVVMMFLWVWSHPNYDSSNMVLIVIVYCFFGVMQGVTPCNIFENAIHISPHFLACKFVEEDT